MGTCKNCGPLPADLFYDYSLRNHQHLCKACERAKNRALRRALPRWLADAAADARAREGVQLTARDVAAIMSRYDDTCALSGKRGGLILLRRDDSLPFSESNAVPVRRSIARRMGFRLPAVVSPTTPER